MQRIFVFSDTNWLDSVEEQLNKVIKDGYKIVLFQVVTSHNYDAWENKVGVVYNLIVVAEKYDVDFGLVATSDIPIYFKGEN